MSKRTKIVLGIILGWLLFAGGIMLLGNYLMRNSEAYPFAIQYIKDSEAVKQKVGTVVDFGFTSSFETVSVSSGVGSTAKYTLKVYGEKDDAKIYILMETDTLKNWIVTGLIVD